MCGKSSEKRRKREKFELFAISGSKILNSDKFSAGQILPQQKLRIQVIC